MSHWIILPIMVPAMFAVVLLLGARLELATQRAIGVLSTLVLVGLSLALLLQSQGGGFTVYELGSWVAPFGIVLVLDRLSALMVALTAVVGLAALLHAVQGWDTRGKNFHALFQFQLMGLNGAFLTGDIFNLFVFFEILLIASYGLILHGGGRQRVGAGLHYVVFNLVGSAFFVVGLGVIYGTLGTLNMADLAVKVQAAGPEQAAILRSGALLLLVVFSVKAALLPLYFWLPRAYSSASAPVAALFAIMTKVGVYAIIRVYTLVFSGDAPVMGGVPGRVLFPVALVTLVLATIGVVAARSLRNMVAYLLIASVGTMLAAISYFSQEALAASLFYMVHSTVIMATLFLLAELIALERGAGGDALEPARPVARPALLGSLFFVSAAAVAGMPPFSGFLGKALVLQSSLPEANAVWLFAAVLGGGLMGLVAVGRAGSVLFWKTQGDAVAHLPGEAASVVPVCLLVGVILGLSILAGPISAYTAGAAEQLMNPGPYIEAVLGSQMRGGTL
ncbi:MAG: monovalent cation/H+ antiporter subunit D [Gemmatimonadota bacterium]